MGFSKEILFMESSWGMGTMNAMKFMQACMNECETVKWEEKDLPLTNIFFLVGSLKKMVGFV